MTVQSIRAPGATTIVVDTVAGVSAKFFGSMGTPHTFIDPITSEQIIVISEATCVDFAGHVDGANIEIDAISPGYTDTDGSAINDIVVIRPTTSWANNVHDALNQSHNDDGTMISGLPLISPLLEGTISGWINANESWAYASASTITVPTNATAKYDVGDYIQLTQSSTVKYFVITALTATVLTVSGLGGVTVANSAITLNSYSKARNPHGLPIKQDWWQEIGRTTLGSAGNALTANFVAKKYLRFHWNVLPSGSISVALTFNGDTAANYSFRYFLTGGSFGVAASATSVNALVGGAINGYGYADVTNIATAQKQGKLSSIYATTLASDTVNWTEFWFNWVNLSNQITSITLATSTNNFAAGSELVVLGHD